MHLNLSGISRASAGGRLLRLPLSLLPRGAVVPILQGPLARRRWIVGAGNHGYWLGSYEYDKQRRFADCAGRAAVVFDIGAHVGFYTLVAAVSTRPGGRVFAFEPLPRNLSFLERHVRLNLLDNVTVVPCAVSDHGGTAHFRNGQNSSEGCISAEGSDEVETVALDELHDAGTIPAADLMKIDVEGAELSVLRGAERMIASTHPTIFLATHSPLLHRSCEQWLVAHSYCVTPLADDELFAAR